MNISIQNSNETGNSLEKIIRPLQNIEFACIINKNGKVLQTFNKDCLDIDAKKKEMLFMETVLQTKMSKDFDNELGSLLCNVTEREDGNKYVSTPLTQDKIVFALMNKDHDHNSFIDNAIKMKNTL